MGQYYQHAAFTLAALDASESGFLRAGTVKPIKRPPTVRLPYHDKAMHPAGYFYVQAREYNADPSVEYFAYVARSELLTRGWVLQESMLSRRTIYYSRGRIFFECCTDTRNDYNESTITRDVLSASLADTWYSDGRKKIRTMLLDESRAHNTHQIWSHLVEVYSGLTLTKPEQDRIVALVGIAKEIQRLLKSIQEPEKLEAGFIAGAWVQHIHHGLLWEFRTPEHGQRSSFVGPTWSWTSWSNAVRWRAPEDPLAEACQIDVTHSGALDDLDDADGMAAITESHARMVEGCLTLRACVALVSVGPKLSRPQRERAAKYTGVDTNVSDRWRAITHPDRPEVIIGWVSPDHALEQADGCGTPMTVIHVATRRKVSGGLQFGYHGFVHDAYCVLFVEAVEGPEGSTRPTFERRGVGRIFQKDYFGSKDEVQIDLR